MLSNVLPTGLFFKHLLFNQYRLYRTVLKLWRVVMKIFELELVVPYRNLRLVLERGYMEEEGGGEGG
jgi:hypothetical protein